MQYITIEEFVSRQAAIVKPGEKQVNLVFADDVSPGDLFEEMRKADIHAQFIALDRFDQDDAAGLPGSIDAFITTGYSVVLTVFSLDALNAYFDVLKNWKMSADDAQYHAEADKTGSVYLLLGDIPKNAVPEKLQQIVDFEYQPTYVGETLYE